MALICGVRQLLLYNGNGIIKRNAKELHFIVNAASQGYNSFAFVECNSQQTKTQQMNPLTAIHNFLIN